MDKSYDPQAVESRWYETWESRNYFAPADQGEPYCIMLPPPNVTGRLHMGHAFQDTLMDALTRYHRMRGRAVLWQGGTDHAGIATQMVVERLLAAEGKNRRELGRDAFVQRVWQFKEESGGQIQRQLRRLGASIDWQSERFTMDEAYCDAVTEHFVRLYEDGLIYRGKRLVNWDPVLLTALSDLEVENREEAGHLWHIRYPRAGGGGYVVVATTRPETLLGDVAVAVHPDDERYAALIGQRVKLPLTDREIPVIADDYVDPDFGTGCLKITPAHDFNDFDVGRRHGFEPINIFTPEAALNNAVPAAFRGLDRFEARERVVAALAEQKLLDKTEDHPLTVPRGDRSGAVLEPYLTDQWFVKTGPLAERAIEAARQDKVRFVPENWSKTYYQWLENIQDWCISRQLWWGHRIPAWYDDQGNVYVGRSEEEARRASRLPPSASLTQDEDVFDTWFSSALWPFATLGWPAASARLKRFYPTSVLVTGFDIIFFWVARMVMAGLHFQDDVPFREVYVHGLIRDAEGQKMSKSKGNVLDPIDLIDGVGLDDLITKRTEGLMQPQQRERIEKATRKEFPEGIPAFGADALRFTFTALATTGRDIRFDLGRIEGYRNFCNKLWNAARFVLMNCEGHDAGAEMGQQTSAERWIRAAFDECAVEVQQGMASYRFDLVAQSLYEFTWNRYCDWYLELAKEDLRSATSEADKACVRQALLDVLEGLLRLLHPIMPFITEELWQQVAPLAGKAGESIMVAAWPEPDETSQGADPYAAQNIAWVQTFITGVRRLRSELDVAPATRIPVKLQGGDQADRDQVQHCGGYLTAIAGIGGMEWVDASEDLSDCATALAGNLKLAVPLAGLIDINAEIQRLRKDIGKREQDVQRSESKLANDKFVNKAPPEIVATERTRLAEHESALAKLREQLQRLESMHKA